MTKAPYPLISDMLYEFFIFLMDKQDEFPIMFQRDSKISDERVILLKALPIVTRKSADDNISSNEEDDKHFRKLFRNEK